MNIKKRDKVQYTWNVKAIKLDTPSVIRAGSALQKIQRNTYWSAYKSMKMIPGVNPERDPRNEH